MDKELKIKKINTGFNIPSVRSNIVSGDDLNSAFGKLAKITGDLKDVAFSGSYIELSDKPAIPSKVSELTNDSGFTSDTALSIHKADKNNPHNVNASQVNFTDGETFQQKYDGGKLKGEKGDKGDKGDTGASGAAASVATHTANGLMSASDKKTVDNMSNPNLLINGDFKIWQRGTSITINNNSRTYTADRWRCKGTGTVTKTDNGLKVSSETVIQYAAETDDYNRLAGKTTVLSYSKNGIVYFPAAAAVSSAILVELSLSANDILNWVKLEIGENATALTPKLYAEELAACQRYYISYSYNCTGIAEYAEIPHGAGAAWLKYILPCNMRVQPSIVLNLGGLEIYDNSCVWKTLTAVNSFVKGNIHIVEYNISNADVTVGHSYLIKNIPDLSAEVEG